MFSRLFLVAALLGIASCLKCKFCDNAVPGKKCSDNVAEDRVCSAKNGGTASCVNQYEGLIVEKPGSQPARTLVSAGCSSQPAAGPTQCGAFKCTTGGKGIDTAVVTCSCNTGNTKICNYPFTYPANCPANPKAKSSTKLQSGPKNGVDGKAGSVFSVLAATIFAALI